MQALGTEERGEPGVLDTEHGHFNFWFCQSESKFSKQVKVALTASKRCCFQEVRHVPAYHIGLNVLSHEVDDHSDGHLVEKDHQTTRGEACRQ